MRLIGFWRYRVDLDQRIQPTTLLDCTSTMARIDLVLVDQRERRFPALTQDA
jgi:hypothetical protein